MLATIERISDTKAIRLFAQRGNASSQWRIFNSTCNDLSQNTKKDAHELFELRSLTFLGGYVMHTITERADYTRVKSMWNKIVCIRQ